MPTSRNDVVTEKRWRRLRRLLFVLLAAEALYLLLANAFLLLPLGERSINRRPEKLTVHWRLALSPLPGLVYVEGLEVRGQNRRVQWLTTVEGGWVGFALPALLWKRFDAVWVRIEGVDLRFRPTVFLDEAQPTAEHRAAYPPIPGLEVPTETPRYVLLPKTTVRRRWSFRFRDAMARDVEHLWIGPWLLEPIANLEIALDYEIRGELEVRLGRLELEHAQLHLANREVAREVSADLELVFLPRVLRETSLQELLEAMSADLELAAVVETVTVLNPLLLQKTPWLELDGGGRLVSSLRLRSGALVAPSRLEVEADPLIARVLGHTARGQGTLEVTTEANAEDGAKRGGLQLAADFDRFVVLGPHDQGELIRGQGFSAVAWTAHRGLLQSFPDLELEVELPPSTIVDLARFQSFVPAAIGLQIEGGTGTIAGDLAYARGQRGDGHLRLAVEDAAGAFEATRLIGDLELEADLVDVDLDAARLRVARAALELERVGVKSGASAGGGQRDWWGRVELADAPLAFASPWQLEGDVRLALESTHPIVAIFAERNRVFRLVRGLLDVRDVRGHGTLDAGPSSVRLRHIEIEGRNLELQAELELAARARRGLLYGKLGPVDLAVELLATGERDWKLTRPKEWYAEKVAGFWGVPEPGPEG